jgi:hypothetical protein
LLLKYLGKKQFKLSQEWPPLAMVILVMVKPWLQRLYRIVGIR